LIFILAFVFFLLVTACHPYLNERIFFKPLTLDVRNLFFYGLGFDLFLNVFTSLALQLSFDLFEHTFTRLNLDQNIIRRLLLSVNLSERSVGWQLIFVL
jgi:hypothetical protein